MTATERVVSRYHQATENWMEYEEDYDRVADYCKSALEQVQRLVKSMPSHDMHGEQGQRHKVRAALLLVVTDLKRAVDRLDAKI